MTRTCDQHRVNAYFTQRVDDYCQNSERGIWGRLKRQELAVILDHLGDLAGLDVLECGCGTGWYTRKLIEKNPKSYIATDCLPQMLRHVRGPRITARQADLTEFSFQETFDRILCAGALEFVSSPNSFFISAAKALRETGRIIVLVPPDNVAGRVYRLWHRCHGFTIRLFSDAFLTQAAKNVGLHLINKTRATIYSTVVTLGRN